MANNRTRLDREVLAGRLAQRFVTLADNELLSLPQSVDDAERDFGCDIYDKMRRDPALASALNALIAQALADGYGILPTLGAPGKYDDDDTLRQKYELAESIRVDIETQLRNLQSSFDDVIEDILTYLIYGHAAAEVTYRYDPDGKARIQSVRVKDRESYRLVVDKFYNVAGLVPAEIATIGRVNPEDVIPREKFLLVSHQPSASDPRGQSLFRPAYNAWWLKQQIWPDYFKYLSQFGTPGILGQLPEGGSISQQGDAAQAMLEKLVEWSNGTVAVLDGGSKVQLIEPSAGGGDVFLNAINLFDNQMMQAVLIAIRSVTEAQHGSRADSETAQDVVGSFVALIRRKVESAVNRDVIRPLVVHNYGEDIAKECSPVFSLSSIAREDTAEVGNMIANLARTPGLIHSSQYQEIDRLLGLPERDFATQLTEIAEAQAAISDLDYLAFGRGWAPNYE